MFINKIFYNSVFFCISVIFLHISINAKTFEFDSSKYQLYIDSFQNNIYEKPQWVIENAPIVLSYIQRKNDEENYYRLINILSIAHYYSGNRSECYQELRKLEYYYKRKNKINDLSIVYNRIGALYHEWGLYSEALKYYSIAFQYALKSNNQERIAQTYNNFGLIHKDKGNYDKAYYYFIKAKEIYENSKNFKNLAYTYNNIGIIYKRKHNYNKAIEYFNQSLEIKKKINDNRTIANSLSNIAECYLEQKNYDKAIEYYNKAIELRINFSDNENLIRNLIDLAGIYIQKSDYEKVNNYIEEIENRLKISDNLPDITKSFYELLFNYYEKTKHYEEALNYLKKYQALKDSINNSEKEQKFYELDYLISQDLKENEINKLRYENQLAIDKLRRQLNSTYFLIITLIIIFSALLILYVRYKILIKTRFQIEEKNLHIKKINEELEIINDDLEERIKERTKQLNEEIQQKEQTLLKLEEALKKAEEANYLKDAFLANINHEIRTPLSAIMGLAEILKKRLSVSTDNNINNEISKYIDGIIHSGNRLMNLFNNIIDYSRIESHEIKPIFTSVNPNVLIRRVGDLYVFKINEKKLELVYNLGDVKPLKGDENLLFKVLVSILDNAVKYTETGRIEISTYSIHKSQEVVIEISDTGIGIDEKYLPHLFEPFRQESLGYNRSYEGAGISLALANKLIRLMGGQIEIASKKGSGTRVKIILPESKDIYEVKSSVEVSPIKLPENHKYKILLVEDDEFNGLFIKTIVNEIAKVDWVKNGQEAISFINQQTKPYDLVILDINLPNKLEGISLYQLICEKHPEYNNVPFIAQTAYSLIEDRNKILNAGFKEYFTKPINTEQFLNTIKLLLINKST